jgi:catechol 2,3-dioxygenase-like lactoylglutathione lyase family enzyme
VRTQVTFDTADPHRQAAFWAEVMGHEVEDHSALVDKLINDGLMPADDRISVDGRSAFREVAACSDPAGVEPRLYFQKVPEGKTAKNLVHLDIDVEPDHKPAEVARLVGLGAEMIDVHSDRGPTTYVLRDPEGNEFCLH